MSAITIAPLQAQDTMAVTRLHAAELSYSFNSQIGPEHLACVYRALSARPDSYVGVASSEGVPVGVVSGTLDHEAAKQAVMRSLGWRGWLRLTGGLVRHPGAGLTLAAEMRPRPPVRVGEHEVKACLTAIAVASTHRRQGLASRLVTALEDFFRAHNVADYWLDTVLANNGARSFYQRLGFTEVRHIGHTVVFLKHVRPNTN